MVAHVGIWMMFYLCNVNFIPIVLKNKFMKFFKDSYHIVFQTVQIGLSITSSDMGNGNEAIKSRRKYMFER